MSYALIYELTEIKTETFCLQMGMAICSCHSHIRITHLVGRYLSATLVHSINRHLNLVYSYDCSRMHDFVPVIRLLHQTFDPWHAVFCLPHLYISDLFSNNREFKMHGDFFKTLWVSLPAASSYGFLTSICYYMIFMCLWILRTVLFTWDRIRNLNEVLKMRRWVLRRAYQFSLKRQFGQGMQELDTLQISMLLRLLFRPLLVGLRPNLLFWTVVLEPSPIQITGMVTLPGDQRATEATKQFCFLLRDKFLDTNGGMFLMRVDSYPQTHFPQGFIWLYWEFGGLVVRSTF